MKPKIIFLISFVVLIIGAISIYYFINISGPINNEEKKIIEIKNGATMNNVADLLIKNELIKNKQFFLLYVKIFNIKAQAGEYEFINNDGIPLIANKINTGEVHKNLNTYLITFIEGKTLKKYGEMYATKTNQSFDTIKEKLSDKKYLETLINKYWFLTEDILDSRIYYPLEGYLFPNTYEFNNGSSLEVIIEAQLNNLEKQLIPYKQYIIDNNLNVHDIITLASIIEKEANSEEDRKLVSGVFTNRLNQNMSLGSDVTTYYAEQVEMGSVTDLYKSQYNALNDYNTRNINFIGLPIGPICNPSISSIEAAIYPEKTSYMYFYADKFGKVYFATTLNEHNINISKYGGN